MTIAAVSTLFVLLAVGMHHEALLGASLLIERLPGARRMRVALAVVAAVIAHLLEILVFALGWAFLEHLGVVELSITAPTLADFVYFSGAVYTSLGFGDIVPVAGARGLAIVEAVTGLVLIAWTASFTFLQMRDNWK